MTASAGSDAAKLEVQYEGPARTFGGLDAADFILRRRHHRSLECNLQLAQDARTLFEEQAGPLDGDGRQALLRALAQRYYRKLVDEGREIPAIVTLRARNIDPAEVEAIRSEAGLA